MNNKQRIEQIIKRQIEFQYMTGFPINSKLESEKLQLAEFYLMKLIEEVIETRKTFPSQMNPYQKNQPTNFSRDDILAEFVDILLFALNFKILWNFDDANILSAIEHKQEINIQKVKDKLMSQLNHEILRSPGEPINVGGGSLSPRYVFVGQNPNVHAIHGGVCFEHLTPIKDGLHDGSSNVLLPILDELGIREQCYITNLVKCSTPNNEQPSQELVRYWLEFYTREIDILKFNNHDMQIIPMGNFVKQVLCLTGIYHPAAVKRGTITREQYKEQIIRVLNLNNVKEEKHDARSKTHNN